jgi:hypothetical protein
MMEKIWRRRKGSGDPDLTIYMILTTFSDSSVRRTIVSTSNGATKIITNDDLTKEELENLIKISYYRVDKKEYRNIIRAILSPLISIDRR